MRFCSPRTCAAYSSKAGSRPISASEPIAARAPNLYYAYDYELATQGDWAMNIVNSADWAPEMPLTAQTMHDTNPTSSFVGISTMFEKQKFSKNPMARHVYNQFAGPSGGTDATWPSYSSGGIKLH